MERAVEVLLHYNNLMQYYRPPCSFSRLLVFPRLSVRYAHQDVIVEWAVEVLLQQQIRPSLDDKVAAHQPEHVCRRSWLDVLRRERDAFLCQAPVVAESRERLVRVAVIEPHHESTQNGVDRVDNPATERHDDRRLEQRRVKVAQHDLDLLPVRGELIQRVRRRGDDRERAQDVRPVHLAFDVRAVHEAVLSVGLRRFA